MEFHVPHFALIHCRAWKGRSLYAYGVRKVQQSEEERRWRMEAMLHQSAVWDEIECNAPRLEFCAGLSLSARGGPRGGSGSDLRCNSVGQTSEIFYEVG
jgi:hypothetical protein